MIVGILIALIVVSFVVIALCGDGDDGGYPC